MKTLVEARSKVFSDLFRCPCCGAAQFAAEKSDALESVTFACTASFYLPAGGQIGVSQECPRPSYVAIAYMEEQAARLVGPRKAVH